MKGSNKKLEEVKLGLSKIVSSLQEEESVLQRLVQIGPWLETCHRIDRIDQLM